MDRVSLYLSNSLSIECFGSAEPHRERSIDQPVDQSVRVSIESTVEKSQYSARAPYAEFDSSGNSISGSCRKPQVICARPASSRPTDATRLRFPLLLCSANVKALPYVAPSCVEALVTVLSRLGNQGNHYSTCLLETYRGYSPVAGKMEVIDG